MKSQIKRTITILLVISFSVSITATVVSAERGDPGLWCKKSSFITKPVKTFTIKKENHSYHSEKCCKLIFDSDYTEGYSRGEYDATMDKWNGNGLCHNRFYDGYYDGFTRVIEEQHSAGMHDDNPFILRAHDFYRKKVGTRPLYYDVQLEAGAQQWAQNLTANHPDGQGYGHSPEAQQGLFGENIQWSSNANEDGRSAIVFLADNEKNCFHNGVYPNVYDHIENCKTVNSKCQNELCVAHYSQIIWSGTKKVGAAHVGNYWVFRYYPPGNIPLEPVY